MRTGSSWGNDPSTAAIAEQVPQRADAERVNWWLRLTSSGWRQRARTPEEREVVRRSRLASYIILGLLVVLVVVLPGGLAAPATLVAIVAVAITLIIALVLNRLGGVSIAGALLVLMISAAVLYAVASVSGGLSLVYLPAYDLLVISVVVAASVLPRWAAFVAAAVNIALIAADFLYQPHAADVTQAIATFGVASLIVRPIGLQIIVATVAFLWARGTDDAIRRADRAEELAALEHQLADQKRQLDLGIEQLLQTHVRAAPSPEDGPPPSVIGIDDFALRKGRTYGTLLVDLERRRVIDLLPERTADIVADRLRALPHLTVVARDRAPEYARAVSAGAPQATQVADRFHLLSSLREAIERYLHRARPELRRLLLAADSAAATPTGAGEGQAAPPALHVVDAPPAPHYDPGPARRQLQRAKHTERERRFQQVQDAHARGLNQRQIARETGLSRATVRLWLAADILPPERRGYRRGGKVDPYGAYLLKRLAAGCTNQTLLWREISAQGFVGTRSLVAKWIRAHRVAGVAGVAGVTGTSRRSPGHSGGGLPTGAAAAPAGPRLPGPQRLAWLVLRADDPELVGEDRALWERLRRHEELAWVQTMAVRFTTMVRGRSADAFGAWLGDCRAGPTPELRNFAASLERDGAAVRAALRLPWSTGPVEGHINKLKLIKRSAYGRMKTDLLRQRVLHAA